MRRAMVWLALCSCTALSGLDELAVGTDEAGTTPEPDAGMVEDAPVPGHDGADVAIEAQPDAEVCGLPLGETFAKMPAEPWNLSGSASWVNPGVQLTPASPSRAGALFWNERLLFDRFEVTVGVKIVTPATSYPADGVAIAWLESETLPPLGENANGMGVAGLEGWAVVIDTWRNLVDGSGDAKTPHVAVAPTSTMKPIIASSPLPSLVDGKEHRVSVSLEGGLVTVTVDEARAINRARLPNYKPYQGFFAFSAATGGYNSAHTVTLTTIRLGTGICAP